MFNIQDLKLISVRNKGDWEVFLLEFPHIYGRDRMPEVALAKMVNAGLDYEQTLNTHVDKETIVSDYTGRFSVRLDKNLHIFLAQEAQKRGISLNALVVQKLSRDYEIVATEYNWFLQDIVIMQDDIILELCDNGSKKSVRIVFDRDNLADTLGDEFAASREVLLDFLQTPDNQVWVALNKFLDQTSKKLHMRRVEIKSRLIVVKNDKDTNSVHDSLRLLLHSRGYPHNISAKEALKEWDDYLIFEA